MNFSMSEDIMVSVVCLTYNHAPYIKNALDSFLTQKTNFKYEVIIHDDASTDATADVIREYEEKYPEIIKPIYQLENQYSKNIKISKTYVYPIIKGKYVAVCEGDDFWIDENKLQKQVDFLEEHPEYTACVHAHQQVDMRDNSVEEKHAFNYSGTVTTQQIIKGDGNLFATNSIVGRAEILLNIPPFRENSPVGDYPVMIEMAFFGKVYYFDEVMSCYRYMVPMSWSDRNMLDDRKLKVHIEKMQKMLEEADRYSEYKYHDAFKYIIDKKWFCYYLKSKSILFLRKNYKGYFLKIPPKQRMYVYLNKYAPFIIKIRNKLRKK